MTTPGFALMKPGLVMMGRYTLRSVLYRLFSIAGERSPTMHRSNISSIFFSSNLTSSASFMAKMAFFFVCLSSGSFSVTNISLGPALKKMRVQPPSFRNLLISSPSSVLRSASKSSGLHFSSWTMRSRRKSMRLSVGASPISEVRRRDARDKRSLEQRRPQRPALKVVTEGLFPNHA
jgi:hypothetical protein